MVKVKTAKILSLIVMISGVIVIAGWVFDIGVLKSIMPGWGTMKFSTALSFFLSGIVLYVVSRQMEKTALDIHQIVLSTTTLIILLLMSTLFVSIFLDIRTGVEDFFVRETKNTVYTTTAGRPSLATMINFILISIAGILSLLGFNNTRYLIGLMILTIGSIAVLGYILALPVLFYHVDGISTAMALHTAILFILTGAGFCLLRDGKKKEHNYGD